MKIKKEFNKINNLIKPELNSECINNNSYSYFLKFFINSIILFQTHFIKHGIGKSAL